MHKQLGKNKYHNRSILQPTTQQKGYVYKSTQEALAELKEKENKNSSN